ncbi:hypothetical protein [uncultured Thiohalocapsa sp.]|uniref:hypothetical protein n=1 Tax=uncultured Thiohalocapsa sp. TaxID=768990 RepID=UPI0025DA0495|nr:hypothetical protein [uncultured Thiohalocapsa sp.]
MQWVKLGQIYHHQCNHLKLASHAANPLAVPLSGDTFRVFFSGRDIQNRSSVGFVDIDIIRRQVVYRHDEPVFGHGSQESFYRDGISVGGVYSIGGAAYMLFMAWQNDPQSHWRGDIGRFQLRQDQELVLNPVDRPFLGSDIEDPISLSYPWVVKDSHGYKMWYGSTVSWNAGNGEMLHVIKYATSADGEEWHRHGQVIQHELGRYQAFSRPTVCVDESGYHMWYSYRGGLGTKYRIGYAFSKDGNKWSVDIDGSGIDVSLDGWDSDMIEYPFVFDHKGERYMLYNGNDYGRTGFGLAVLEK